MCADSVCSAALLVSHSVPLQSPWLTVFFFFFSPDHSLLLCFCVVSKPFFPCPARMISVSLYFVLLFLFYCFAASMRCKFIEIKGHALCASLSPKTSTRYNFQEMHRAWCSVFKDSEALARLCSHGSRGGREADVHSRPQLLHLSSHHASSHKWMWNSFNAIWTILITSPLVHLEANTQLNTIRKLQIFSLKVYRGDENFPPWVSGRSH